MPHQVSAIDWGQSKKYFPCFMEMRLGKSLVIIRWAKAKKPEHVLILAPTSTIPDWTDELRRENIDAIHLTGSRAARAKTAEENCGWFITNYEGVCIPRARGVNSNSTNKRYDSPLLQLLWDVVILDESTKIKNPKAAITRALIAHSQNFAHRAVLSGYPAPESPLDYFCQMAFLYGHFCNAKNWWNFRDRHFHNPFGFEWFPRKGMVDYIKRQVHATSSVLRRKDVDIGSKKFYERRVVELNPEQRRLIRQIDKDLEYQLDGEIVDTKYVITAVLWMARIAGGFTPDGKILINPAKQKAILELLKGELNNQSVLIWFRFNSELHAMRKFLKRKGYEKMHWITGEVPVGARKVIQAWFNRGGSNKILLMQVQCGKMGIDLSAADTAIYYSNSYSGEARAQSEDRIIHPVKKRPLLYVDIVSGGSVDEDVIELIRKKAFTAKRFMARLLKRRYGWRARDGKAKEWQMPD
jgi:SNF2 family DNA or RNA helicase